LFQGRGDLHACSVGFTDSSSDLEGSTDLAAILAAASDAEATAWALVDSFGAHGHQEDPETADSWAAVLMDEELAHAREALAGSIADADVEARLLEALDGGVARSPGSHAL